MRTEEVKKLKPIERLAYWITERESIRLKKEAREKAPWTDDEILQTYRFCNVRRMDDKVSKWLEHTWYSQYFNHKNMLPAVALARFINKPESLAEVGFPKEWKPATIKRILRNRKEGGVSVFNGAYMVRGNDGEDKVSSVVDFYVQPLVDDPPMIHTDSMELTHGELIQYYGMGSFMAGQIVADLRWAKEGSWEDYNDWAPMGPGSARGMNRLHERDLKYPLKQKQFLDELQTMMKLLKGHLPESITSRLEAIDFQNVLCETDKYARALFGEGKPKQLYRSSL